MFRKFSEWAVAYAIRLGYIKEEEQEEYTYGLDLIMSVIASDLTMLIIGIIMKMIPQVIVLYLCTSSFASIRADFIAKQP